MDASDPLNEADLARLARHAKATWAVFIGFWIAALLVILAYEVLGMSEGTLHLLLGGLAVGVVLGVLLQFSQTCARCGANLGRQVRLGIPERCRRCGVALKAE